MSELCLILGATGSGRAEVAADLARYAWPEGRTVEILPQGEGERAWKLEGGTYTLPSPGESVGILLTDGRCSQVDQLELLIPAAAAAGWSIRRIITVIDLGLLHRHPELESWFRSCLHFSDAAILSKRTEVPNGWLSSFQKLLTEDFRTCLVTPLPKSGGLPRPAELIEGEPRRASLALDDLDAVDEMEFDEDNLPDEPFDLVRKVDLYFARDPSGRREMLVPDIAPVLLAEGR